jgi:hypothetical protein
MVVSRELKEHVMIYRKCLMGIGLIAGHTFDHALSEALSFSIFPWHKKNKSALRTINQSE